MRKLTVFFIVILALTLVLPVSANGPDDGRVVQIAFASPEELAEMAARLDVWEVHHDETDPNVGYVIARVSAAEADRLMAQGADVQEKAGLSLHPDTIPGFPCYRTIAEIETQLASWESQYPTLTYLSSLGSSYEGRPLSVIRLTNEATGLSKPVFFLMANIHGRELITPETAMVFIQYLLENYNVDPDVTWLLDEHVIFVVPSANPDGHIRNEPGQPWAYWRKNTHPYGSCSASDYGVDLNRNFAFHWGGDSTYPCDETYQGPSAASEPETQLVQNYILSLFPDRRGPGDNDPAPDTTSGVMITLHSYSNLVLWPWGHANIAAPNGAQLQMFGRRMASFNNYTPQQAVALYPTTGTTDDWSYGELGVASFTFEMGSQSDGFYPSCSRYSDLIQPTIDALFYAAKVARTPYITAFGPHTLDVTTTLPSALVGQPVPVQAMINDNDSKTSGQTIVAAEAYLDVPPWDGGTPYPLAAADGAFDETSELVQGSVGTSGVTRGRHLIYVRGRDADGYWGPVSALFVELADSGVITGVVRDADSNQPLSGVAVSAAGAGETFSALTNSSGAYFIPLSPGTYTLSAARMGYGVFSTTVSVDFLQTVVLDIALQRLPWGVLGVELSELGTALPLSGTVLAEGVSPAAPSLVLDAAPTASVELPAGAYTLTATVAGHSSRQQVITLTAGSWVTAAFRLPPPMPLLVVDDDVDQSYETYILPALDASGFLYDVWSVALRGRVTSDLLALYDGIIWFTGDDATNSVSRYEQEVLRGYLNDGGRLFLTGQNIGMDIKNDYGSFFRDVLSAVFVQDSSGDTSVSGLSFYGGISATLAEGSGANNQSSPDVIAPYAVTATPVFTYSSGGGTAGLAVEQGAYRLIYLSFGLEGVADATQRITILRDGLAWLGAGYPPARLPLTLGHSGDIVYRNRPLTFTLSTLNDSLMVMSEGEVTVAFSPDAVLVSASNPDVSAPGMLHWSELSLGSEASQNFWWTVSLPETSAAEVLTCAVAASWPRLSSPAQAEIALPLAPLYGVTLSPATSVLEGVPGSPVTHVLTLTNTGTYTNTYIATMSEGVWPAILEPASPITLASEATAPLTITVMVPQEETLLLLAPDVVTVTVAAFTDPDVKASSVLTTNPVQVTPPGVQIFLPLVLRES
ncbi:MAG: carboxypeptidase regulatory-like domain-containing protein [Anaerolineae bacterium]|nr:carboxypeptidase regulatory-like domain-containing protein [Anaerolineae bacterium]